MWLLVNVRVIEVIDGVVICFIWFVILGCSVVNICSVVLVVGLLGLGLFILK